MSEWIERATRSATVLGCGFMGSALARALADEGNVVTVWNRTYEKAEALAGGSIRAVREVDEAVWASDLVVACVRDYRDLGNVLDGVDIAGKTLVNLTSGTATQAESFAARMSDRGVRYLDGAIICYPENVGTERGTVLLSGDREAWAESQPMLMAWGPGVEWVGEDPGLASAVDSAVVGGFHISALLAFVESANYALDRGVPESLLLRITEGTISNFGERMRAVVQALRSGDFATDQAALATYAQALRGYVDGLEGEGYWVPLMRSSREMLDSAEALGLGREHISAVVRAKGVRG